MKRKIHVIAIVAGITLAPWLRAGADDNQINTKLLDAQTQQEQLRAATGQVRQQLDAIIAEFQRNGLDGGSDVKTLQAIRKVLNNLSADEMTRIINLLQNARALAPSQALHAAANAQADQNNVINQLQSLLREYQRQQAINDLAARFSQLADQENINLGSTVQTVRGAAGRDFNPGDPAIKDSLQVQSSTQATIQIDVANALNDLAGLLQTPGDNDLDRIKKAQQIAADGKLNDQVSAAAQSIRAATLIKAAAEERDDRDLLRNVSRTLAMPRDTLGRLEQSAREIDKQIAEQKQVKDQTNDGPLSKPKAEEAERKQADVVDQTDLTRKDLDNLAPAAADNLKKAQEKMQQARADLNNQQKELAAIDQQAALDQLKQAKQAVADQIAKQAADKPKDKDNLATLSDLKKQTDALKSEQDKLKDQTAANPAGPKAAAKAQAQLDQKAQDIQQKAADASPQAAKKLDDASSQMDKAEQNLDNANPDPTKAADSQQAASDDLAQASQAMDKDIKQLQQDHQQEQQLSELTQKLRKIIQAQIKENLDTGLTAAKPTDPLATAPAALGATQAQIGNDTDAFRQALPDQTLPAVATLNDAKTNMDGADRVLARADVKAAQPLQKTALDDLYKTLAALDQQVQDLQQALGQKPPDNQQQMAELAKQLDQLQQATAQAAANLDQPTTQPATTQPSIAAQQQQIAQGLQKLAQNQPQAANQKQIQQAQQNAQQAASDLQKGDQKQAAQDMQKAQDAMQQAQKDQQQQAQQQQQPQDGNNPTLPQLAQAQQDLQQQLAQQSAGSAGQAMKGLAQQMGDLASGDSGAASPDAVQQAMQAAQQALADAAQQAQAGDTPGAKGDAGKAQAAMAQAQAGLAMAQAGAPQPGQGQDPSGQPGGKPQPGQANEDQNASSSGNRQNAAGNATDPGHAAVAGGAGQFINLPPRDRAALQQSQAEKYPQAYSNMVEQYLQNLSRDDQDQKQN